MAGDRLVVCSERGELLLTRAVPAAFQPELRLQILPGRSWVQPTVGGSHLFLKNNLGDLVCLRPGQP